MAKQIIDDSPMGYVYINESFISNDNKLDNVVCYESKNDVDFFYITFDANLQDFDVQNRNHRYYDAQNIWECILTDKIQSLIRTGGWFGEFDHPTPDIVGEKLTPERIRNVPPPKRAFKILSPKLNGNILSSKIQSAQGEVGESFAKEVLAGWIPQFSCRAIAHMVSKGGKPYVIVRQLITYDAPWYPSHEIAHATSAPKVTTGSFKNFMPVTESAMDCDENYNPFITDVYIPVTEILKEVGEKDVNTNTILEAFDLSFDDLVGFSKSKRQVAIRDDNNMLYVNINPDVAKKVDDFFASFH